MDIILDRAVRRKLKQLDRKTAARLVQKVEHLAANRPDLQANIRPMADMENTYRLRVGDWRILYRVDDDDGPLVVLKIGSRGDVYR
ncbi:type II toxin-antitoxin system RelE family toxin [Eilatimonas milleporae]|uniref:mRNA interferase RelE/StbE n=1 Tax=Eilatimonas milleporae TaxID=911205 RepID=A0A3M0CVP0_9PROT|nr:type II toxin-antitoxin system RelE/ParE family toxin [Eilatimonas milleporae]RMB13027.1 mRNA interferase RelE/StbE [Eilatimonas milleporae]